MITQLPSPIEMTTPLGEGYCILIWQETNGIWYGVAQDTTGELWWWQNHHIRISQNLSEGRPKLSEIKLSKHMEEYLKPHIERHNNKISIHEYVKQNLQNGPPKFKETSPGNKEWMK